MRSYCLRAIFVATPIALALLTGCSTSLLQTSSTFPGPYQVAAYKPNDPSQVRVKVSLQNRMVYVMEGSRPLLVTPGTIGIPGKPTPTGHFNVSDKIREKRSSSYGFWVNGSNVIAGTSDKRPGSGYHYIGYPMPYWVQFKPEYGFHAGPVWPVPHSHGCIRLHPHAAPAFFALVHAGTPVDIAASQPEDQTIGKNVARPGDYTYPDPPGNYMVSSAVFTPAQAPLLQNQ